MGGRATPRTVLFLLSRSTAVWVYDKPLTAFHLTVKRTFSPFPSVHWLDDAWLLCRPPSLADGPTLSYE